ncbi:MAG: hypothetical protein MUE85_08365 [Microscillaceae bacterium]|nr:hypothetical protein [Microscillaceae bacterium]
MESKETNQDLLVRKRQANKENFIQTPKGIRVIRLPIREEVYHQIVSQPKLFRAWIENLDTQFQNLFGEDFKTGFKLHDIRKSAKMDLSYRRIEFIQTGHIYTIQPSFVMPYLSGKTSDCQAGLLLLLRGTSLDSVVACAGENQAKWLRRFQHLGKFSLVETTVKSLTDLPQDLVSDEKITHWNGQEVYACIIAGSNCILGAALSATEDEAGLKQGYQVFKTEVQHLVPDYQPNSVNTDGWAATRKTWRSLFVNTTLILCFLHAYIKIRSISKKEPHRNELFNQVWQAYQADSKEVFVQKITQIDEWAKDKIESKTVLSQIEKMKNNADLFATSFDCGGKRTSNMVDRAIRPLDKFLVNAQYFHGHFASAQLTIRALALGYNFLRFYLCRVLAGKPPYCGI